VPRLVSPFSYILPRFAKWPELMAVFWVQHYYTLPIIFEDLGMGNEPPHGRQPQLTDDADDPHRGTTCMRLALRLSLADLNSAP